MPGIPLLLTDMIIKSLELKNFRNYDILKLSFDAGTNLLYGDNAQGKTNVLEALYLSAAVRSHRGNKDRELIRFREGEAHIKVELTKRDIPYRIDIHLKKDRPKGIAINGVPIRRASELFGIVNMVLFSPEDLSIIKNSPADRRRFMDVELCQLDSSYAYVLTHYEKSLKQRNRLLKEIQFHSELRDTLDVWDEQLIKYGSEVMDRRRRLMEGLNPIFQNIYSEICGGSEEIEAFYDANVEADYYRRMLIKSRESDCNQKTTSVGPHRDDIGFLLKKIGSEYSEMCSKAMDLRTYGSQGQQRTAALSLKLAEIELMKRMTGENPILLLDDVLSELDTERQRQLLTVISKTQTVLTSTGMENLLQQNFKIDKKFRVVDGRISTVI